MKNLVDRYTVEAPESIDDGVVAIEYVVVGAAVVVGLAAIFGPFGETLRGKLGEVIDAINVA